MGRQLANKIGEIDYPLGLGFLNRTDDVIKLGNIAADHFDFVAKRRESSRGAGDIDIHTGHFVALGR